MATVKKSLTAPEASKDAPAAAPQPPSDSVAEAAVKSLQRALVEAIERAIARLPENLRSSAFIIETVLQQELDKVSFSAWRTQAFSEVVEALQSGKSEVKHDPTELA